MANLFYSVRQQKLLPAVNSGMDDGQCTLSLNKDKKKIMKRSVRGIFRRVHKIRVFKEATAKFTYLQNPLLMFTCMQP
jgi:hypothetical protein